VVDNGISQPPNFVVAANVEQSAGSVDACLSQVAERMLECSFIDVPGDKEPRALASESLGDGLPNSARTARDQRDFIL
jgi:hypothetical protein